MNKKHVDDSPFLKEYVHDMCHILFTIYPDKPKDTIKSLVKKRVEEDLMNPGGRVENSYTHEAQNTTLLSVLDY